ncbi:MAG: biotin--[acetyl-CoA-carboxylase] ligase [Ruminococcaceae bacterium]|nr:biotin--[acetyl-CoA-carboxylase] ligase [Oscillospiraceae bacterium]
MTEKTGFIQAKEINSRLHGAGGCFRVETYETVDSTNAIARERAADGEPEGLVVIASAQTAGRGRKGRSFFSPESTGIYMSLLLRPQIAAELALRITTVAAVSVCQAIEKLSSRRPGIKWVNDIFIDGRKVCGILTETALAVGGRLEYAVLGIGVNALEPEGGFPDDIRDIAGSVFAADEGDRRAQLAAEIISCFAENYAQLADSSYAEEYRRRCIVPGSRVMVLRPDGTREADALDVDDECRLLVRYDDGTEELLYSGEISIKLNRD